MSAEALYTTGCCKTSGKLRKHITETLYGVFFVFLGSYDCQIWAIFHFGTLWAYGWKKSWKIWPWKKARFQGWLKLADFMVVEFWGLPTLASIISGISSSISKIFVLILLQISWIFQSIPNCLHFDDSEGRYGQKSENQEINLSQPWNLAFFQGQIFQLFFYPYAQRVPKWKIVHIWQS